MALNARQRAVYRDTCSIYKPTNSSGTSSIGAVREPLYELVATGVVFKYDPNRETSMMTPMGRIQHGSIAELELAYFDEEQELKDQYCIKLTTTGHPLINHWFTVIGEPEFRPSQGRRVSNYLHAWIRSRVVAPTIRP